MPSSGDTLSLGALGKAVGVNVNTNSQTALAANGRGSTGTQTSLSDFYISAVDSSISDVGDTTPNESTDDDVTIGFANEGSLFASRIKDVAANFTWARSTTLGYQGGVTFSGNQDYRATVNYGTEMARTEVTREINSYIRAHKLQDPKNGRRILADAKLRKLLKLKKDDELTYFNLQRYMSPHFAKANKALPVASA